MREIVIAAFENQTDNFKADLKREFEKEIPRVIHPHIYKTKVILLTKLKDEIESTNVNTIVDIKTIESILFSFLFED
ncbi:hypothetical protein [Lutibacter maritimus]|uniref:Uncharacterized protein n=1 Tax=Lutibacter maritimus TaxID=593133 RepID=A0A1I6REW7_9FLAO|nr:hypothetical protein [Lutibacter maritimus]SFS63214.1 hypothetical protein SAMN04488006_2400 [Lutibacter maritimus]